MIIIEAHRTEVQKVRILDEMYNKQTLYMFLKELRRMGVRSFLLVNWETD